MRSRLASRPALAAAFMLLVMCLASTSRLRAQAGSSESADTLNQRAEYDPLIDRALAAFEAARYPEARSLFEAAHALQPSARTLRGLGLTAFQLRDYDIAQHELEAAMRSTLRPLTPVQRVEVGELLAWMATGLGTLQLTVSPEHAIAAIDDRPSTPGPILLDPGEHQLRVQADGHRPETRVFSLELGQALVLHVQLQRLETVSAPAPPLAAAMAAGAHPTGPLARHEPDPRSVPAPPESDGVLTRWWFWTAIGAVAVGTVVVAIALTQSSDGAYEEGGIDGVVRTLRIHPSPP